jgi:hypothetical protein
MEALLIALGPLITQQNIAVVVLGLMVSACGWLHIVWRREDREERKGLQSVLGGNTEALIKLQSTLEHINREIDRGH